MNFFYQRIISAAHDSGDYLLLLRPEIPIDVVGSSGFLDYFTATFDGKAGHLTLVPNEDLPAA